MVRNWQGKSRREETALGAREAYGLMEAGRGSTGVLDSEVYA